MNDKATTALTSVSDWLRENQGTIHSREMLDERPALCFRLKNCGDLVASVTYRHDLKRYTLEFVSSRNPSVFITGAAEHVGEQVDLEMEPYWLPRYELSKMAKAWA